MPNSCSRGCGYSGRPHHVAWHERACLLPRTLDRLAEIGHAERVGDCLIWRGRPNKRGSVNAREKRPYVVAYEIVNGPVPDGLYVCHHCDVPGCFEPNHLYAGTPIQNMRDASQRRRLGGAVLWSREQRIKAGFDEYLAEGRRKRWANHQRSPRCGFVMPRQANPCGLATGHSGHHKTGSH